MTKVRKKKREREFIWGLHFQRVRVCCGLNENDIHRFMGSALLEMWPCWRKGIIGDGL